MDINEILSTEGTYHHLWFYSIHHPGSSHLVSKRRWRATYSHYGYGPTSRKEGRPVACRHARTPGSFRETNVSSGAELRPGDASTIGHCPSAPAPRPARLVPCRHEHEGRDGVFVSRPRRGAPTQPNQGKKQTQGRAWSAPVTHAHHVAPCSRPRARVRCGGRAARAVVQLGGGGRASATHPIASGTDRVERCARTWRGTWGRSIDIPLHRMRGSPGMERAAAFI